MKTLKLALILICLMTISANAQVAVKFNTNINTRTHAKPSVKFYNLPDAESYYDSRSKRYAYVANGKRIYSSKLPGKYKKYPYYRWRSMKIAGYHGARPYAHCNSNRRLYRPATVIHQKRTHIAVHKKKHGYTYGRRHK